MRVLFAAIFLAVPVLAAAQSSQPSTSGAPPLPTIGLPLPDIGLPPPEPPQVDRPKGKFKSGADRKTPPARRQPPRGGQKRGAQNRARTVYVVPTYPAWNYQVAPPEPEPAPAAPEPAIPTGTLSLNVEPAFATGYGGTGLPGSTQVYVDNVYIGTMDDVGAELTIEAGTHNVELRAPGYEPLSVNVKVDAGRVITYRGTLQRVAPAASSEPVAETAPAKRKPIYAIPGCYLGDVPPKEANLPPTCDPNNAITIKP